MMLCANFAKKVELSEIFKCVRDIGLENIQFSLVHFGINDDNPVIDSSYMAKAEHIKNLAEGINFPVIHGWLPSVYEDAKEVLGIYENIRIILESNYIVFHPKSLDNLKTIIRCINESKGNYLIENVAEENFMMKYPEVDMIVKNGIGICFDTCHALENGLDINAFLDRYKKSIKMMHLSDFDGKTRHAVIGTSKLDKDFIGKIPNYMIVVFEHKAKTLDEYRCVYSGSFRKFNDFNRDNF